MNVVHLGDYSRGYATEDEIEEVKCSLAMITRWYLSAVREDTLKLNDNLPFHIDTLDFFAAVQDNVADLQDKLTKAQEKISGL
jgi:hypothetical protein